MKKTTSTANFVALIRDVVSPDPGESLLKVKDYQVKIGFGECKFVDFGLEVQGSLRLAAVLKKREKIIRCQEPKASFVENFLK